MLLALGLAACARDARPSVAAGGDVLVDDFGDSTRVVQPATRIVSLNPSTTEVLFAIGAGSRVVGRTTWDGWPDSARLVPSMGDALRPNVEVVLARKPDLVLLYASEDNRAAAAAFRRAGIATLTLRNDHIADFARTTMLIARLTGDTAQARRVVDTVTASLARVRDAMAGQPKVRAFWKTWDRPLLTIGKGSFLSELLAIAGGENLYDDLPSPSPAVTLEDVARRDPDVLLVAPGGERTPRASPAWRAVRAVRE
ncbi:MAG: ABC transporter substrate-binding protein, partial [Gemmatimonadetes bacterium]|nr:ABC transporter substrate-binding protein [Gemmatimonadota bacterium]